MDGHSSNTCHFCRNQTNIAGDAIIRVSGNEIFNSPYTEAQQSPHAVHIGCIKMHVVSIDGQVSVFIDPKHPFKSTRIRLDPGNSVILISEVFARDDPAQFSLTITLADKTVSLIDGCINKTQKWEDVICWKNIVKTNINMFIDKLREYENATHTWFTANEWAPFVKEAIRIQSLLSQGASGGKQTRSRKSTKPTKPTNGKAAVRAKWVRTARKVTVKGARGKPAAQKTVYRNSATGELRVRKLVARPPDGIRRASYVKF
jgi:hypothetical protein